MLYDKNKKRVWCYIEWDGEFFASSIYLSKYLHAAVTHGKRGEHKPRNGDRIHTSVPVYLLMVLQGHREGVALLVVWHHGVRLRASGRECKETLLWSGWGCQAGYQ